MKYLNLLLKYSNINNVFFLIIITLLFLSIFAFYLIYIQKQEVKRKLYKEQLKQETEQEIQEVLQLEGVPKMENNNEPKWPNEEIETFVYTREEKVNHELVNEKEKINDSLELQNITKELEQMPQDKVIALTPYEIEQEQSAIISYDELMQRMKDDNEFFAIEEDELDKESSNIVNKVINKANSKTSVQEMNKPTKEETILKTKEKEYLNNNASKITNEVTYIDSFYADETDNDITSLYANNPYQKDNDVLACVNLETQEDKANIQDESFTNVSYDNIASENDINENNITDNYMWQDFDEIDDDDANESNTSIVNNKIKTDQVENFAITWSNNGNNISYNENNQELNKNEIIINRLLNLNVESNNKENVSQSANSDIYSEVYDNIINSITNKIETTNIVGIDLEKEELDANPVNFNTYISEASNVVHLNNIVDNKETSVNKEDENTNIINQPLDKDIVDVPKEQININENKNSEFGHEESYLEALKQLRDWMN